MKKKSLLTLMAATTAFSGVAAVSQPNDAEAATSAKSLVIKAEKSAQKLAAEINYDKRKKMYPKSPVGMPNSKVYKETKAAYSKALAAVKKAKSSERKVLQARLDSKVKLTIDRTAKYINAINTGKKLLVESSALDKNVNAYKLDSKTQKSYEALSADYAKLTQQIGSVYGPSTRISLNKAYTYKVAPVYKKSRFAFNFKSNTDKLAQAIKDGDYTKAQYYKNRAGQLIAENKKYKYSNVTTTLYKQLIAAYNVLAVKVSDMVTTYKAVSTDAANPTLFGGTASQPLTINHDVVIEAGAGKYIALQNVVVNGNVIIKGDATGAGTVTLNKVKVNEMNAKGGQIIVDDVAEHSLYLNEVQAKDVVVNDANGSNIVAQSGTQVGNLVVSEKAGATGTVTLNSAAPNAFGTVTVSNKGNEGSNGIVIKGDYSNVKLIVVGDGQKITIDKDAKIKELEVKSNATIAAETGSTVSNITIAAANKGDQVVLSGDLKNAVVNVKNANASISVPTGTVVGEIKKDASVTGTVTVDNKGTIEKAEEGITVDGNKPVEVVKPPVTPPVGGGPGPNPDPFALNSITATLSSGGPISNIGDTISLSGAQLTAQLTSLTLNANRDGFTVQVVSIDGYPVNQSFTEPSGDGNTSITLSPKAFFPAQLRDGISLSTLKSVFGAEVPIVFTLTKDGATVSKTITLELNGAVENPWFDLTRLSNNGIQVTLKQPDKLITDMYNYNNMDETTFITALLLANGISTGNAEINFNNSNVYNAINSANIKSGLGIIDGAKISTLNNKYIYVDVNNDNAADYTISFVTAAPQN